MAIYDDSDFIYRRLFDLLLSNREDCYLQNEVPFRVASVWIFVHVVITIFASFRGEIVEYPSKHLQAYVNLCLHKSADV